MGETVSEIAAMSVGYTSAVPAPRSTAATAATPTVPLDAASSARAPAWTSIPATIRGLRPTRSDQWPAAIWPRPQTAG